MLDLNSLDLEDIGNALADQTDYEHRCLINPQAVEIAFWTADTIDGQAPVDLDDLDVVCIDRTSLRATAMKACSMQVFESPLRDHQRSS